MRQILSALPGVEERPCYGTPGFYYRKKFMARLREDGESLALKTTFADREHLLMTDPKVFFLTDHYRDYPAVLVHLSTVKTRVLRELLEDAWRRAAPKRVVAEWDAA